MVPARCCGADAVFPEGCFFAGLLADAAAGFAVVVFDDVLLEDALFVAVALAVLLLADALVPRLLPLAFAVVVRRAGAFLLDAAVRFVALVRRDAVFFTGAAFTLTAPGYDTGTTTRSPASGELNAPPLAR